MATPCSAVGKMTLERIAKRKEGLPSAIALADLASCTFNFYTDLRFFRVLHQNFAGLRINKLKASAEDNCALPPNY
jgi:hypothetical protein